MVQNYLAAPDESKAQKILEQSKLLTSNLSKFEKNDVKDLHERFSAAMKKFNAEAGTQSATVSGDYKKLSQEIDKKMEELKTLLGSIQNSFNPSAAKQEFLVAVEDYRKTLLAVSLPEGRERTVQAENDKKAYKKKIAEGLALCSTFSSLPLDFLKGNFYMPCAESLFLAQKEILDKEAVLRDRVFIFKTQQEAVYFASQVSSAEFSGLRLTAQVRNASDFNKDGFAVVINGFENAESRQPTKMALPKNINKIVEATRTKTVKSKVSDFTPVNPGEDLRYAQDNNIKDVNFSSKALDIWQDAFTERWLAYNYKKGVPTSAVDIEKLVNA